MSFLSLVRIAASVSAICLILSPVPTIIQIHKEKDTGPMSVIPLVAMFGANCVCMLYGLTVGDIFPIFTTYGIGTVLAALYLSVYLRYSSERKRVVSLWVAAFAANCLVALFAFLAPLTLAQSTVNNVVGVINSTGSCLMYASPFATLRKVFETKNVVYIPIRLVLAGIVVNTLWSTYGFLVMDFYVIIPCVIGVFFTVAQTIVYIKYRRRSPVAASPSISLDMLEAGDKAMSVTPTSVQEPKMTHQV